jgi:hypothetical protein
MLELAGRDIPIAVLAGMYSIVLSAAPTLSHFVFAAGDRPLVTTNHDELIEAAGLAMGSMPVTHLHGLASQPSTIMTTAEYVCTSNHTCWPSRQRWRERTMTPAQSHGCAPHLGSSSLGAGGTGDPGWKSRRGWPLEPRQCNLG